MAAKTLAGREFIVVNRRICAKSSAFEIRLMSGISKCESNEQRKSYRVLSFVAPPVWRSHISISLDSLSTACPKSLVLSALSFRRSYSRHLRTFIIMVHHTTTVGILDMKVELVAPNAMEPRRRSQCREERRQVRQCS